MTKSQRRPSLDDVLDEFSMEADPGRQTLERYLLAFPEYAGELVDLSRELGRPAEAFMGPLTDEELDLVETSQRRHSTAVPRQVADPFAPLATADLRRAASALGVPRQVLTAFRERRVLPTSVPKRFMTRLAKAIGASVEAMLDWVGSMPMAEPTRSYKANEKPAGVKHFTLERILTDAGVPADQRAELLSDTD